MTAASGPRRRVRGRGSAALSGDLVTETVHDEAPFLLELTASVADLDLGSWLARHRERVDRELRERGAVLLRGFAVDGPAGFGRAARTPGTDLLGYLERAAPRTQVADGVFTSTELNQDLPIPLHHEMSYSHNWPSVLYFYCASPAPDGGATPLASERTVTPRIPAQLRERFTRYGVQYVRNYGPDLDLPWQDAFQTTDRASVAAYCEATRTDYRWTGPDGLRTRATRQAMATHPRTGDVVWFNHAHVFHVSNLPADVAAGLLSAVGPDGLPRNAYYGDGTPIESEALEVIRGLYRAAAIEFPWRVGDVLALDNFLVAHGRTPFHGDRRVFVAMSDLYVNRALA
ncbi:MAG: TauD/TfdA family dioxygenase [Frankia sp.]